MEITALLFVHPTTFLFLMHMCIFNRRSRSLRPLQTVAISPPSAFTSRSSPPVFHLNTRPSIPAVHPSLRRHLSCQGPLSVRHAICPVRRPWRPLRRHSSDLVTLWTPAALRSYPAAISLAGVGHIRLHRVAFASAAPERPPDVGGVILSVTRSNRRLEMAKSIAETVELEESDTARLTGDKSVESVSGGKVTE